MNGTYELNGRSHHLAAGSPKCSSSSTNGKLFSQMNEFLPNSMNGSYAQSLMAGSTMNGCRLPWFRSACDIRALYYPQVAVQKSAELDNWNYLHPNYAQFLGNVRRGLNRTLSECEPLCAAKRFLPAGLTLQKPGNNVLHHCTVIKPFLFKVTEPNASGKAQAYSRQASTPAETKAPDETGNHLEIHQQGTSRQSSSADSAQHSDVTTSSVPLTIERHYSSSSALSSLSESNSRKPRVVHVVALRGRYVPPRVRHACSCCSVPLRRFKRRALRHRSQSQPRPPQSRTDSESTDGYNRFIHCFSFVPDSDESESESSDSDSTAAQQNCDDSERYFFELGLLNIEHAATPAKVESENRNVNRSRPAPSRCDRAARGQMSHTPASELTWSQSDERSSSGGISYTYSLQSVPPSSLPAVLTRRLRQNVSTENHPAVTETQDTSTSLSSNAKKVRFAEGPALVRVRPLRTWSFWSKRARQDEYQQRKIHFEILTMLYMRQLSAVLSPEHRTRIFHSRFAPVAENNDTVSNS